MGRLTMKPHWEALTAETQELFHIVAGLPFISDFYLAGGTGLALHIGHRFSVDLDFFSDSPEAVGPDQRGEILDVLKDDSSLSVTWDKDGTFVAQRRGVGVSFFRLDQHPLVRPAVPIHGIRVASIEEIGAMKLAAMLSRGTRKDYIDSYFILQHTTLTRLFEVSAIKYPYHTAFPAFAIRALAYFEDAESDPVPRMIEPIEWEVVKSCLEKQALNIGKQRLELEKLWQRK